MTGNLDYLREAKAGLNPQQQDGVDDALLGILSVHIPPQLWADTVDRAVRLMTMPKRENGGLCVVKPERREGQ